MGAAKKLSEVDDETLQAGSQLEEIPNWKKKKLDRQKLLRAIRAKSFTETIRGVIRKEIKKHDPEDG